MNEQEQQSLGADHMQPVEVWSKVIDYHDKAEVIKVGEQWFVYRGRSRSESIIGFGATKSEAITDAYHRIVTDFPPQPAPAPREISDEECLEFCQTAAKNAGLHHVFITFRELAIARYAIESRAPQTAPRDPYKRGQLLP